MGQECRRDQDLEESGCDVGRPLLSADGGGGRPGARRAPASLEASGGSAAAGAALQEESAAGKVGASQDRLV